MLARLLQKLSVLPSLIIVIELAGTSSAALVVDATNDVGSSAAAHNLMPSNFWAQSFTVGTDGLLSKVEVQVGKFSGAASNVSFELRPLVAGTPTLDNRGTLFTSSIDINDIPVINSLTDPAPFVSVDVSGAGLHVKPGDVYAISMLRSGGTPAAAWRGKPNSYAGGTSFFRSLLNVPWTPNSEDLGFRTTIDSAPTAPYKLRVDPTFDVEYRPGTVSSLVEGESVLYIGGFPGDATFPEQRPILEYPITGLPTGAVIQAAHMEVQYNGSSGSPRIEITGFAGDGLASLSDATVAGTLLATTGPTSAISSNILPLDASYISSLVGHSSYLGLRLRSLDLPQYVGFYTKESNAALLPPRLVIEYSLPFTGDYNHNGIVDAADFTVWRDSLGSSTNLVADGDGDGTIGAGDYNVWEMHFGEHSGSGATGAAAAAEPGTLLLFAAALFVLAPARRFHTCKPSHF